VTHSERSDVCLLRSGPECLHYGPSGPWGWTIRRCQNAIGQGLCVFGGFYYGLSDDLAHTVLTPR
jgi:hypothetical protein